MVDRRHVALAWLVGPAAIAQIEFAPPVFVGTNDSYEGQLAVADFDEDGHADLVVQGFTNGLRVCLGDGTGHFAVRPAVPLTYAVAGLVVGDFDEDGHADVVLLERRRVHVYLGDGRGGLAERGTFRAIDPAGALASGDFDEDGHLDLVATSGSSTYAFLGGNGNGTFAAPRIATGYSTSIVVADFDEDGHLDLMLAPDRGSNLGVYRGMGTGVFCEPMFPGFYPETVALVSGDFLEDGHVDVVVIGSSEISVLWGGGDGTFRPSSPHQRYGNLTDGAAADFDGDEHLDLLYRCPYGIGTCIRPGDGSGTFETLWQFATGPTGRSVVADFDEDGHPDVAAPFTGGVNVFLNSSFDADPVQARSGNVNLARGPGADVLLVNGSPGNGDERRVGVDRSEHFVIRMNAPPSHATGPAPFALYAWPGEPTRATVNWLPRGVGRIAMGTPLTGGSPRVIWNTIGATRRLGASTAPASPAPAILVNLPNGVRRAGRAFLQGIVLDTGAPNGFAAVTNGVEIEVR